MRFIGELQAFLDRRVGEWERVRILEAGCGSASRLVFGAGADIVGIDLSARQLERNALATTKIVGDIQTYPLPVAAYDLIICWDVLEHLERPELAVANFARAVAPGGLIVLKQPNPLSVKGIVTRLTPHGFHVWFYRVFFKMKRAGTDDVGPFKTYLKLAITPGRLRRLGLDHGLAVVFEATSDALDTAFYFQRPFVHATYRLLRSLGHVLSLGRLGDSDFVVVFQPSPAQTSPGPGSR